MDIEFLWIVKWIELIGMDWIEYPAYNSKKIVANIFKIWRRKKAK